MNTIQKLNFNWPLRSSAWTERHEKEINTLKKLPQSQILTLGLRKHDQTYLLTVYVMPVEGKFLLLMLPASEANARIPKFHSGRSKLPT